MIELVILESSLSSVMRLQCIDLELIDCPPFDFTFPSMLSGELWWMELDRHQTLLVWSLTMYGLHDGRSATCFSHLENVKGSKLASSIILLVFPTILASEQHASWKRDYEPVISSRSDARKASCSNPCFLAVLLSLCTDLAESVDLRLCPTIFVFNFDSGLTMWRKEEFRIGF